MVFGNSSSFKGAKKSVLGANFLLEILLFPKDNDLDRPEFVFKPYQLALCIRTDPFQHVSMIFGNSVSFKGAKKSVYGANFTRNTPFPPKDNDIDQPEFVFEP